MTIGDVLAVVAGIGSACVAVWALLLGMTLLFNQRTNLAQQNIESRPWRVLATGGLLALVGIGGSIVLLNQPNGLLKLLGWVLLLGTLMLSALGASGLARLLSQCVQSAQPAMSEFGAILRGAGILIAAGLVPLLGWFFVVPLSIIISTGAGWYALRGRAPSKRQTAQQETPHIAPVMPHPVHPISGLNGAAAHNGVTHSGVAHSGVEVVS